MTGVFFFAQGKFDLIFVSLQLIGKLEEKCNSLPSSHKKALSADSDEIMYTTPGDVGIYYDDNGQLQVSTSWNIIQDTAGETCLLLLLVFQQILWKINTFFFFSPN